MKNHIQLFYVKLTNGCFAIVDIDKNTQMKYTRYIRINSTFLIICCLWHFSRFHRTLGEPNRTAGVFLMTGSFTTSVYKKGGMYMGRMNDVLMDYLLLFTAKGPVCTDTIQGGQKALKKFMEDNPVYQSLDEETALAASALIGMENFEENMEQYYEEEGYNMCTALREMVEDSRAEGKEEGRKEGVLHNGMRCYLNALSRGIPHEDAMAIAEITEENAQEAVRLREEGKI